MNSSIDSKIQSGYDDMIQTTQSVNDPPIEKDRVHHSDSGSIHTRDCASHNVESRSKARRVIDGIVWTAKDQWFLIVMGILIAISSQVQVPQSQQDLKTTVVSYAAVSTIFFLNGCAIPSRLFLENLARWKIHVYVQFFSYLVDSAIAFGIMSATASNPNFLNPELLIGIIIVGSLPTAIAFNTIVTRKSHGNAALSTTQSTIGNIIGPFVSTALIRLYMSVDTWYTRDLPELNGGYNELYGTVLKQLGLSVFVPLAAGQFVTNFFPDLVKKLLFKWHLVKLGSLALLTLIWQTYDEAFAADAFAGVAAGNIVYVIFISVALILIFFGISFIASMLWLPAEDTVAVGFVVCTKTPAIGIPLTGILFAGLDAPRLARLRIATVFFQALQAAVSSILSIPLRRWVDGRVKRRND